MQLSPLARKRFMPISCCKRGSYRPGPVNGFRQNSAISKEMEGDDVGEVILTMKDIDKSFVGVHALKNACLELKRARSMH